MIAIGDIHGCVNALDGLLDAIQPTHDDCLVVLGDFIDQGYESRLVIERLLELQGRCELVCLLGNHEEMLLAALTSTDALRYWETCGGAFTLSSYRLGATIDVIPDEHLHFIRSCRDYFETERHIFVHANCDPDLPLPAQPAYTLRWEILTRDSAHCHQSGKTVICGHTEQSDGEVLDLGCFRCIDTACWRYGWLTALDVVSGRVWQATRFGQLRKASERPVGPTSARFVATGDAHSENAGGATVRPN